MLPNNRGSLETQDSDFQDMFQKRTLKYRKMICSRQNKNCKSLYCKHGFSIFYSALLNFGNFLLYLYQRTMKLFEWKEFFHYKFQERYLRNVRLFIMIFTYYAPSFQLKKNKNSSENQHQKPIMKIIFEDIQFCLKEPKVLKKYLKSYRYIGGLFYKIFQVIKKCINFVQLVKKQHPQIQQYQNLRDSEYFPTEYKYYNEKLYKNIAKNMLIYTKKIFIHQKLQQLQYTSFVVSIKSMIDTFKLDLESEEVTIMINELFIFSETEYKKEFKRQLIQYDEIKTYYDNEDFEKQFNMDKQKWNYVPNQSEKQRGRIRLPEQQKFKEQINQSKKKKKLERQSKAND